MDYDRITELPEPVLHNILSFIPTRDALQTRLLSKRWRCVWNSSPILDFDCYNFFSSNSSLSVSQIRQIVEKFMDIVDKSLLCRELNLSIEKFRLVLRSFEKEFTPRVNNWVQFAIERNVKELNLNISNDFDKKSNCRLPLCLFAAKSITVLRLQGFQLMPSGVFEFSSLTSLSLIGMYVDDQIIRNLIFSCPLIEILILEFCHGLKFLQISSLQIKTLELNQCVGLESVEIDTPSLQSFLCNGKTISASFSYLKTISLEGFDMTEKFQRQISQCDLLESLKLVQCHCFGSFKICNQQLKSLVLDSCYGLRSVEIDTPSLQSFLCNGKTISCEVNAASFSYLKTISLEGVDMTEKFQRQISQCDLLESLKLVQCNCFGSFKICNQQLKSLVLDSCYGLLEAEIETQNLLWFMYAGDIISLALINTSLLDAKLRLSPNSHDTLLFTQLRDFLGRFGHAKVLTLVGSCMIIPKEMREGLLPPLYDLKHLKAEIGSPIGPSFFRRLIYFPKLTSKGYAEYLDGFLWSSPRLETIDLVSINKTLKFKYEKLAHPNCCNSIPIRSWQQCLKKVTIENFEGTDDEFYILTFFLKNAKALEMIKCIWNLKHRFKGKHVLELSELKFASPNVKVVFC